MNEFKMCPAGGVLYNQLCDAVELVLAQGNTHEPARQAAMQVWTDHKDICPVCSGLKARER